MNGFEFSNIDEIIDDVNHHLKSYSVKMISIHIDEKVAHIEFHKWLASDSEVFDLFTHIMSSIICSQNIFKPQYVTNHIVKESTLDVEGDEVIMNFIVNEEFDTNDYYK